MGNRLEVVEDGVTTYYSVNEMNQYITVAGDQYQYDADGNLLVERGDGFSASYEYDPENRLTTASTPSISSSYTYGPAGNRVSSVHDGNTTVYVTDPSGYGNLVAEYETTGELISRLDYGHGLLSRVGARGNSGWYTFDAIGSTAEMTDLSGTPLNSYACGPWGNEVSLLRYVDNPFVYAGEQGIVKEPNDLYFMRARYYSAVNGRFVTEDPIGIASGDMSLYRYAANNPVSHTDPSGLEVPWGGITASLFNFVLGSARTLPGRMVGATFSPLGSVVGALGTFSDMSRREPTLPVNFGQGVRYLGDMIQGNTYKQRVFQEITGEELYPYRRFMFNGGMPVGASRTPEEKLGPGGFHLVGTPPVQVQRWIGPH
jgi:RHS repeat-associated protein